MKRGFYAKIGRSNIRKNYRFFIPKILTEAGLLAALYIIFTLMLDHRVNELPGGEYIPFFMLIGVVVMGILSAILIFYTNSFLMRQRTQEFALYNILGMEKKHVGRVLFFESFYTSLTSAFFGIGLGILFYKASSLLVCRLLQTEIILGFYYITPLTIIPPLGFYLFLDFLCFRRNRRRIAKLKPVEMLQNKNSGEREPKVKWVLFVTGLFALASGYALSVMIKSPMRALKDFFLAVLLVIIGTYFLFVSGSIFVLKLLKKNKKYYYSSKHYTTVSGLLYRMKQNAVGLASITILATGVLVMISSTVSLYSGMREMLDRNYPQDFYLSASTYEGEQRIGMPPEEEEKIIRSAAAESNLEIRTLEEQEYLQFVCILEGDRLVTEREERSQKKIMDQLSMFTLISEKDYCSLGGEELNLQRDEIAVSDYSVAFEYTASTARMGEQTYRVVKKLSYFPIQMNNSIVYSAYGLVVSEETLSEIYEWQREAYGEEASEMTKRLAVTFTDRAEAMEKGGVFTKAVRDDVLAYYKDAGAEVYSTGDDSYWDAYESCIGMYGTLLFLGILLGLVCLFATTLIIYYKQISEGYEDRSRFQIMEKVGMSAKEVKRTVNRQVVLVFFLPIIAAGLHMAFAIPILSKLLAVLMLSSTALFVRCTVITGILFALVYVLIYEGTARTYYKIVR